MAKKQPTPQFSADNPFAPKPTEKFSDDNPFAPKIPLVEEPTEARPPFAEPSAPPELTESLARGEGGLGVYSPAVAKQEALRQVSPPLAAPSISEPKPPAEVDLQSVLRPKPVGTEAAPTAIKAPSLLPEEKRKEYNYYETNYASIDAKKLAEKKNEQAIKVRQLNGAKLGLNADVKQFQDGLASLETMKQVIDSMRNSNPVEYQQAVREYEIERNGLIEMQKQLQAQQAKLNIMATEIDNDANMINLRDYELKSKQGGFLGATWNNLLSNVGTTISGVNTPLINAMIAIDPPKPREGETQDQANNRVRRIVRESMRGAPVEAIGDEGTTKEYIGEMQKDFLGGAWLAATGTLPLAYMGPGGIGLMASAADNVMQEMEGDEFANIPEWKKMLFASSVGVIIGRLEKAGIQQAVGGGTLARSIMANALSKLPQGATNQQLKAFLLAETESAIANAASRIGGAMVSEAATEFQQGVVEPLLKDIFNAAEEKNLLDVDKDGKKGFDTPATLSDYVKEAFYQAAQGAIGGSIFATPNAVFNLMKESKVGKTANDTQFEMTEELLNDPEFAASYEQRLNSEVESGKITQIQANETLASWKEAQQIISQIPNDIKTDMRREAFDLLTEKAKLKKKDPALVGDRIKQIDNRLAELSKMKQEAPKPAPATEAKVAEAAAPAAPTKLELEAQKAEIEDRRAEELERVNIAVAEASETGASPELDGRAINPEQEINSINAKYDAEVAALTQPKPTADAVQERTTAEVGAQPIGTEGAGQEGRGGVGPSVQGPEAPQAGRAKGEVKGGKVAELVTSMGAKKRIQGDSFGDDIGYSTGMIDGVELVIKESEADPNMVILETIATDPSKRGRGLASKKLQDFLSKADELGLSVMLNVDSESAAAGQGVGLSDEQLKEWYKKRGFFFEEDSSVGVRPSNEALSKFLSQTKAYNSKIHLTPKDEDIYSDRDTLFEELEENPSKFKEGNLYGVSNGPAYVFENGKLVLIRDVSFEYDVNSNNYIPKEIEHLASNAIKRAAPTAEGPVRPEAPPAPKAETMKLMNDIASLEQKMEQTSNKGVKTRYQNQINKLAPKIGEVMAKFDSTVADLEKSGKLKRRCP